LPENRLLKHIAWAGPTAAGLIVYLSTLCRTVYVGDSGEFSLVFATLGIAHPPGYPLFTLLGSVFVHLAGFWTPALAANVLTALLAAAVIPVIFLLLDGFRRPLIAGSLVLLWAFLPGFWEETAGAEVYGLNVLFVALLALAAWSRHPRKWLIAAYLLGLALAHHLSVLAVVPALAWAWVSDREAGRVRELPFAALLFVLGISLYLYLPVRSALSPLADWGHPTTWERFWSHLTAQQYQSATEVTAYGPWQSLKLFAVLLYRNGGAPGLALVLAGLYFGWRRNRRTTVFFLLVPAANLLLAAFYRIPDIDPYYLPGLLAVYLAAAGGIAGELEHHAARSRETALAAAGLGLAAALLLILNFGRLDRSDDRLAETYGRLILDTAGSGLLFTHGDNASFSALYLRYAEGYRPQVEVYDQSMRLRALLEEASRLTGRPVDGYTAARDALLERASTPHYLAKAHYPFAQEWTTAPVTLYSHGILYAAQPPQTSPLPDPAALTGPPDFKSRQILVNMALSRGEELLYADPPDTTGARSAFRLAMDYLKSEPRAALHNQLGIAFRHLGAEDFALAAYDRGLKALRLTPRERDEIIFNVSNIYKDRGNRRAAAGDAAGALEAFSRALEYDPGNGPVLFNVGYLHYTLGRPRESVPYLESYLRLNPGDARARQLLEAARR